MALLGNILWFILFGLWNFILYGFLGVLCCITIIGIPIGKALFQYAKLMALPFGKVIIKETELKGKENVSAIRRVGGVIANIIWLPVGILMFLENVGMMIVCCISLIGIPAAVVIAKSCTFLLWPVGAKVITKEEAEALRMERAMVRAMETTGTAGNMMNADQSVLNAAIPQNTGTAQPNQFLENLQESGGKALESFQESGGKALETFKEAGGKTLDSLKENGGKAVTAIAATGSAGLGSLKEKQRAMSEQMFAKANGATLDELLEQMEVKLYQNKVMAWIMPFLEYIMLAAGILFILVGLIAKKQLLYGVLAGLAIAAPLMLIAALLGMVKRSHIFVLIVLGIQLAANLITWIVTRENAIAYIFAMICYAGVIAWYVFTFVLDMKNTNTSAGTQVHTQTAILPKKTQSSFCAQCGTAYTGQIKFCAKCGASLES